MKADPQAQRLLLDLQGIDTALDQLAHRRATLPELAEVDNLTRQLSELEDERVRAQVEVDDLDRHIARLERDVEQVRARKERDTALLASGRGPARELEALQHEIESLNRRQNDLEDSQLELMERREQAQGCRTWSHGSYGRRAEAEANEGWRPSAGDRPHRGTQAARRTATRRLVAPTTHPPTPGSVPPYEPAAAEAASWSLPAVNEPGQAAPR